MWRVKKHYVTEYGNQYEIVGVGHNGHRLIMGSELNQDPAWMYPGKTQVFGGAKPPKKPGLIQYDPNGTADYLMP